MKSSRWNEPKSVVAFAKSAPDDRRWKKHPQLLTALEELLQDATAGDPVTGLKWTRKTSAKISRELKRCGYGIGADTVRRLLRQQGYRLRANRKRLNQKHDPQRDRQMRYLIGKRRAFQKAGLPVISVDAKQRELVGISKTRGGLTAGRRWRYWKATIPATRTEWPSRMVSTMSRGTMAL